MRRSYAIVAAVAASVLFAVAIPGAAQAASGGLIINGVWNEDPTGCLQAEGSPGQPVVVENQTDAVVAIYNEPDCAGQIIDYVYFGDVSYQLFGQSLALN